MLFSILSHSISKNKVRKVARSKPQTMQIRNTTCFGAQMHWLTVTWKCKKHATIVHFSKDTAKRYLLMNEWMNELKDWLIEWMNFNRSLPASSCYNHLPATTNQSESSPLCDNWYCLNSSTIHTLSSWSTRRRTWGWLPAPLLRPQSESGRSRASPGGDPKQKEVQWPELGPVTRGTQLG